MNQQSAPGGDPPQLFDVEMEQALIGALIIDNSLIDRVRGTIVPWDLYDPYHQRVLSQIFDDHDAGRTVSPLTIRSAMKFDPGTPIVGENYLISIARSAPALPNVVDYCRILADWRLKRDAFDAITWAQDAITGSELSALTALQPIVEVFDLAAAAAQTKDRSQSAGEAADMLFRELEEASIADKSVAIPTGIDALDEVIGGLFPENLIIVAGRPGMGKSILATTIAHNAARAGFFADLYSLEMSGKECAARLVCDVDFDSALEKGARGLAYNRLSHHRRGRGLSDSEWARAIEARDVLASLPIHITDRDRLTMAQISGLARARAARSEHGRRRVIIIDHLGLIDPSDRYKGRKVDELSEITKSAKQLAKMMKCPVVLLSQLSRDVEKRDDKHPGLADLRDSGSIEQDADVVLFPFRPEYYAKQAIRSARTTEQKATAEFNANRDRNLIEIDVAKNRHGPTEMISAWVDVRSSAIRNAAPGEKSAGPQHAIDFGLPEQRG